MVLATGSGLKDVASVLSAVEEKPAVVQPNRADVSKALGLGGNQKE